MNIPLFLASGLLPALNLLPAKMGAPEAQAMVVAICLQESRLQHRKQIGGPARGFAQFEKGGVSGVLSHPASRQHAEDVCWALEIEPKVDAVYEAIAFNDVLMAAFSRLLLYTLPDRLPGERDHEKAWNQYLAAWRPGKPHRHTWDHIFDQAWSAIK